VDNRNLIVGLWQTALGTAFVGLGVLGIFRSLSPAPLAPRALPREPQRSSLAPYADHRIGLLRARLHRAPDDPELQMSLARAYTARAMVTVHQEYSEAFPTAFQEGKFPVDHYETWRRGWCHRDRDGDLRRALHHARRVLAARPPTPLRLSALRLVAYILRQRSQEAAAIPVLKEAVALAPRDALAWNLLADLYRLTGDTARFREAHRRLQALDAPQEALPVRIVPDLEYRGHGPPQAANAPHSRAAAPASG
jgi:tetratricopeptide (TPR) repeat protein